MLCSTDAKDRVIKESFFPISLPSAKGYFELLAKRAAVPGGTSYGKFVKVLDTLEEGDELAFKGGPYRLKCVKIFHNSSRPSYISACMSNSNVCPCLQLQGER